MCPSSAPFDLTLTLTSTLLLVFSLFKFVPFHPALALRRASIMYTKTEKRDRVKLPVWPFPSNFNQIESLWEKAVAKKANNLKNVQELKELCCRRMG